jgi:hypothetical protein
MPYLLANRGLRIDHTEIRQRANPVTGCSSCRLPSPVQKKLAAFMTKPFARFARKARISEASLWEIAFRVNTGAMEADLSGGVIKQRVARAGEGKSGGARFIIACRFKARVVFVFGFEKKDMSNIDANDLESFRAFADLTLGYTDAEIAQRVADGALIEIDSSQGR